MHQEALKRSTPFTVYFRAMLGILGLLVLSFVVLAYEQENYEVALNSRAESIRYAEELRQSSNDLTRLMRTYIITGNPIYKDQFETVIAIREGRQPRPSNYSLAYWDFKAMESNQPSRRRGSVLEPMGETIPLLVLMRRAGLTDAELDKLRHSKATSDELVAIEQKARAMVEGSEPVPPAQRLQALSLLSDERFLTLKAEVMRPIMEMEQMVQVRTQKAVTAAHARLTTAIGALFVKGRENEEFVDVPAEPESEPEARSAISRWPARPTGSAAGRRAAEARPAVAEPGPAESRPAGRPALTGLPTRKEAPPVRRGFPFSAGACERRA